MCTDLRGLPSNESWINIWLTDHFDFEIEIGKRWDSRESRYVLQPEKLRMRGFLCNILSQSCCSWSWVRVVHKSFTFQKDPQLISTMKVRVFWGMKKCLKSAWLPNFNLSSIRNLSEDTSHRYSSNDCKTVRVRSLGTKKSPCWSVTTSFYIGFT